MRSASTRKQPFITAAKFSQDPLLLVADIQDSNHGAGVVLDRLIAGHVGHAKDRYFAIERLAHLDRLKSWPSQHGANGATTPVRLRHIGRNADESIASLRKQRRSAAVLLRHGINDF